MEQPPHISLIADSGIQFYELEISIDPNADVINRIGFWERIDLSNEVIKLEYAKYISESEIWVSRRQLFEDGYLDENGNITEDANITIQKALNEQTETFAVNDILTPLEQYKNNWIPLPYFESNSAGYSQFGPTNWARVMLIPKGKKGTSRRYKVILIFDTSTVVEEQGLESPSVSLNSDYVEYNICGDLNLLLNFCDSQYDCDWVTKYIAKIVYGGEDKVPDDFPSLKYIGQYIYFVKYLQALGQFPSIRFYPNRVEQAVDVDLVLDIGNSRTCGVLFESVNKNASFKFTEVKKLKLQDLSSPEHTYSDPFSMRLAFFKNDFGEIGYQDKKFQWPSFIRVGREAQNLIYKSTTTVTSDSTDFVTHHSSPKRYLWDDKESTIQWELVRLKETDINKSIYLEGISQQFTSNGSFTKSADFGITSNFSRKSLMTFVFIEILAHAMVQINSHDFRSYHGNSTSSRRLRRVVITCPTAMVRAEQIILRQCAEEASIALSRYFTSTYEVEYDASMDKHKIEIIPSVKDLKKKLSLLDTRKDWIYDEATCSQLVFLYAEVSKRYLNNCTKYFNLYGKNRDDLYNYDKKSITIGSVDIGGGTTDLMINAYQYDDSGKAVLTPVPLYWESFNYAGDDLLKQIIQQIIIEGKINDEKEKGCKGAIENFARSRNIEDIKERLNRFFGTDANTMNFETRQMRKKFNVQISIPIAEQYLSHAQKENEDAYKTFEQLFPIQQPSIDLLDYFYDKFGFRFEDIKWKFSTERVNDIVETVFEPMIKQLSTLLYVKGCDFVLLAGRPTSLKKIEDLFLKFYPVSPNRIISLDDYRVGRWYPFQDDNGYFQDYKSIVAVGACVALMGGKLDNLPDFRLNVEPLKKNLISTAEHFGIYDRNTRKIDKVFITPEENKHRLNVAGLPIMIGFKRLAAATYPGRVVYLLDFDDKKIIERKKQQLGEIAEDLLLREVEDYKTNLKNRMPFTVRIYREYREDRELLLIESIEDKKREPLPKSIFKFRLQTLDEEKGYWLDTGEFHLQIRAKL